MPNLYLRSIEPLIAIVLGCMRWKSVTLTAGGDAKHLQRAAPFEPPLAQHCPTNSKNDAEETAGDDDGGSRRLEIGGFHLRKRDVCGDADHDDGREGLF
jgi:hypothetical protein